MGSKPEGITDASKRFKLEFINHHFGCFRVFPGVIRVAADDVYKSSDGSDVNCYAVLPADCQTAAQQHPGFDFFSQGQARPYGKMYAEKRLEFFTEKTPAFLSELTMRDGESSLA